MLRRLEQYRRFAVTCAATDYGSPADVERNNAAADAMRRIVAEPGAVDELLPLLSEPATAKWLAFQLLELNAASPDVAEQCRAIIGQLANGTDAESLAARWTIAE